MGEVAEKQESRREQISKAFEAAEKPAAPAPEAKAETAAPEKPLETDSGRARDESGRFTEKKASGASPTPSDAPKVEAVAVSEAKAARKYPSTWKRDYEPVYRKLESNPEFTAILDEIERRESDHLKQIGQYKPNVDFATNVRKALEPYQPTFQQLGMDPLQAISGLLQADQNLRMAPAHVRPQLAMQLLQSYGIDPASLGDLKAQVPALDPALYQIQTELQNTKQQVQQFMSSIQQNLESEANSQVEAFKEGKPHFDEVREEMAKLINAGLATNLQEAYDKAVYANPTIRAQLLAEQQAKADAERKQKEQQNVERAKSAAVQVKGAPSGGANSTTVKAKDRRAMIAELINRA